MFGINQSRWHWGWQFLGSFAIAFSGNKALAQITPDGTLGAERSVVTPNINIKGYPADRIDGGATRGVNLFHSFSEFNVNNGQRVYFANPTGIQNILTRITGNNPSNILGLLGVEGGNANLFLINPRGILFGPNAQLDVGGSFVASTASSLVFPNGYQFSATSPQSPPLLTINVPLGLQFGQTPSSIRSQHHLDLPLGKTLALVGGDITIEAGIGVPGGRIELGSVGRNSLVTVTPIDRGWALGYDGIKNFQDIQLSNRSIVGSRSIEGSADIQVYGRNITLSGGSQLEASTTGSRPGGTVSVNASESLKVSGTIGTDFPSPSGIFSQVSPEDTWLGATGAGGNINIQTKRLIVENGAAISATTLGPGHGGNVTILASESVEVIGTPPNSQFPQFNSGIASQAYDFFGVRNVGEAGNVRIETGRLIVRDGGGISTSTFTLGNAGNLTINASEFVELIGTKSDGRAPSGIDSQTSGGGNAGDITISTPQLILRDGGTVAADTRGAGRGGSVIIKDTNSVELIGTSEAKNPSSVFPSSILIRTTSSGNAGNLSIDTKNLLIRDGARVFADTSGSGRAGTLAVNADSVEVIGTSASGRAVSGLYFDTSSGGNAGDLRINTGQLVIRDGGKVSASTSDQGQGGTLAVNADTVEVSGISTDGQNPSRLFFDSSGAGDAGELTIATRRLTVRDGGQVSAATSATGRGGILAVEASDSVEVSGTNGQFASGLYFDSSSAGDARGISINTGNLTVQNGGQVTVSGTGSGAAGDLEVTANSVVLNNQAKLTASTIDGRGGTVNVTALESLNVSSDSGILAQAMGNGSAGSVRMLTDQLTVRDGSQVAVSSAGSGTAGNLEVTANSVGLDNQAKLSAETGSGSGGSIQLQGLNSLTLSNNSQVSASTVDGRGGNVEVKTSDSVNLSGGSSLLAQATGNGSAGSIRIATNQLTLQDGSQAAVSSAGSGSAGNLEVTANSVGLDNQAKLSAETVSAKGGNINFQGLNSLSLSNNSQVSASTVDGQGGNVDVKASDSVNLSDGSSLLAQATGNGSAGSIRIAANQLTLQDGSQAAVSSAGSGSAGNLEVTANSVGLDNQAKLSAETISAKGGNIQLEGLNSLTLSNNSQVSASTVDGRGGNVEVKASDSVNLSGDSSLSASATGNGSAGSLRITTNQLTIQDGGRASVSNTGSGSTGNLEVKARSIFMNNQGNLTARTVSGEGGNIQIKVADTLLLRNNSNILTEALGSGNGGNIIINAGGFVLAVLAENSDIAATAIQGRGGNIFVTAQGVFGFSLPERLVRTPDSDISAASQLGINGTREINTRNVQPVSLPEQLVAPDEIASDCDVNRLSGTGQPAKVQFYNTGRGGLPPSPSEALNSNTAQVPWVTLDYDSENSSGTESSTASTESKSRTLVEAQGWVILPNGKVILTAQAPNFSLPSCVFGSRQE